MDSDHDQGKISRVYRSKEEAEKTYSKMSRTYDFFAGTFEAKYRNMAFMHMNIDVGEEVLEIGFGTGHSLQQMSESVGENGKVYGIDISSGMLNVAKKRLKKADLLNRVELTCGNAVRLPYKDNIFDAVFISFTLELFDTPEIPIVLYEIRRVLKPEGRFGIISMSKGNGGSRMVKLYEWAHMKFPNYIDCRPIYLEKSIKNAMFQIRYRNNVKLFGLPLEIILATI
ncbi:MAG: class I SAM-dependent methyltransferase [Spirochaetia bacterium]|nr:class I SAM-dependent methyltransferase [Spirochaetia bacterium]